MTTKRILLIIEHLGSGGAERQICGLASLLTQRGYSCRLITYVENQFYEPFLIRNNVDYEFVPDLWDKKTRVYRLVKYLKSYRPDVVISYLPSVTMTTCLARIFYKCKLIVSERNNNTSVSLNDRLRFNLYRMADYVVPNSFSQGQFINKYFSFLQHKVRPIVNYVDINHFLPAKAKLRSSIPRIMTAARYTSQKNCLTYLEAVRMLKDQNVRVHFDWYGSKSYDPSYFKLVEAKALDLNIEDYISFHDSNRDILSEYQKSDAFCLPSLYEGYPNVLVEAMSCGLPILCGDVYDNPYIVEDIKNGFLFRPSDPKSIADAIVKLLALSDLDWGKMGELNRKQCTERNSSQQFVESYIKLIEC